MVFVFWLCLSSLGAQQTLTAQMEQLLQDDLLKVSDVGIAVFDLTDSVSLYTYREQKTARPASTLKLITSITHLARMNTSARFATSVYGQGELDDDGVLHGNMFVKGRFDSEFMDADMDELVASLKAKGVRKVKGKLYGDVSFSDSLFYGEGWCWDDAPYDFQPMLSPLMFHKGCVDVSVVPYKKGVNHVTVVPRSSFYTVENLTTNSETGKFSVGRDWMNGKNDLVIQGGSLNALNERMTISRPADFFMHTFRERAHDQDITIKRLGGFKVTPPDAFLLVEKAHATTDVLHRALKESDNLAAEALFYHLGAWQKGCDTCRTTAKESVQVIRDLIRELGYRPEQYEIHDGSGVSLYNYVSPELMLAFLKYAHSKPEIYKEVFDALPIAGVDGTLKYRMKGGKAYGNVRAKTGTVSGVSTLAGYLKADNGHEIAFVIMNQQVLDGKAARSFQDKLCEVLCSFK